MIRLPKFTNDKAKDGDQLGLIDGCGTRRVHTTKIRDQGSTRQVNLIDGLDCEPGQLDLAGVTEPTNGAE